MKETRVVGKIEIVEALYRPTVTYLWNSLIWDIIKKFQPLFFTNAKIKLEICSFK